MRFGTFVPFVALSDTFVVPVDELKHALTPYPEAANVPVGTALNLETAPGVHCIWYRPEGLNQLPAAFVVEKFSGVAVLHVAALLVEQPVTVTN